MSYFKGMAALPQRQRSYLLNQLIDLQWDDEAYAGALGVSQLTLARALAGYPLQPKTRTLLENYCSIVDAPEPKPAPVPGPVSQDKEDEAWETARAMVAAQAEARKQTDPRPVAQDDDTAVRHISRVRRQWMEKQGFDVDEPRPTVKP